MEERGEFWLCPVDKIGGNEVTNDPAISDQLWIDAARVHFPGPVIVGKDLLEI